MSFLNVNKIPLYLYILQDSFGSPNKNDINEKEKDINNFQNIVGILKNEEEQFQRINDYTASIINFQLKTYFSKLETILRNKMQKTKHKFFIFLKNNQNSNKKISYLDREKIKKNLKSSIVVHKIQNNCLNLLYLYKEIRNKKKMKQFLIWHNKINVEKNTKKIENSIKDKYYKLYENSVSDIINSIKKKEKSIEDLKLQEKKIGQNIKQREKQKEEINKKINELEQKIEEASKNNEKLEKEKNEKETLTNSNTFSSLNKKENNEEIIKELEMKINELDKEKNDIDVYFKNFYEEMINMMNIFEDKLPKIIKMKNNESSQKKLEINIGGEIFDSLNHFKDFGSSDNIKGNNGKKFFGNEKHFSNNKTSNLELGSGNKSKNNKIISGGSSATTHCIKGNENNREIFINHTDNFKNKI